MQAASGRRRTASEACDPEAAPAPRKRAAADAPLCVHAAHSAAPAHVVAALRAAYESRFGWPEQTAGRLFVALPRDEQWKPPGGLWELRPCCATPMAAECLRTLAEEEPHCHGAALAPRDPGWALIGKHHTAAYCALLRGDGGPAEVAHIFELSPLSASRLAHCDLERDVLLPARRAVGASILAAPLAIAYGGCVLIEGGQHHASSGMGAGASLFADTIISYLELRAALTGPLGRAPRALYVDLDVHLSDGVCHDAHDLRLEDDFVILDAYNEDIWPVAGAEGDREAPGFVHIPIVLHNGVRDPEYMRRLAAALAAADVRPRPDVLFYVAGMDVLAGDAVGGLRVTEAGIVARDDAVLAWAGARRIPVVFLAGGGYSKRACAAARTSVAAAMAKYATDRGALAAGGACPRCRAAL